VYVKSAVNVCRFVFRMVCVLTTQNRVLDVHRSALTGVPVHGERWILAVPSQGDIPPDGGGYEVKTYDGLLDLVKQSEIQAGVCRRLFIARPTSRFPALPETIATMATRNQQLTRYLATWRGPGAN
jgi:hypothetical protein